MGGSTSPAGTSTCSSARRTSSSGRTWGLAFGKEELLESLRPYKVRPSENRPVGNRFQHGTQQHELLAGFVAAVEYVESLGWEAIVGHETQLGQRFLDGLPDAVELYGLRTMEGRVPTFAFNLPGRSSEQVATELAARRSRSGTATTTPSRS